LRKRRLLRAVVRDRGSSIVSDLAEEGGKKSRRRLAADNIGARQIGQSRGIRVPGRSFPRRSRRYRIWIGRRNLDQSRSTSLSRRKAKERPARIAISVDP